MPRILDGIASPKDLKGLDTQALTQLAKEIREEIVATVSVTGGHLGASLGVVELTLALHSVLDAPRDKIIWDVGHQAYPHKLVTGRKDRFRTLRQAGGISGFPRIAESEYDAFGVGHAGTSISAALGYAIARDRKGEEGAVVAVIGDGALTAGMAFEALNHAGDLGIDLVVIINDNEMSISPNVGALSAYLTRLRMDQTIRRARSDLEAVIKKIPGIGEPMVKSAERLKDTLIHMVTPGSLFEALGFSYYGPIDGHNIPLLQRVIRDAVARRGPVVIHAVTEKGRGYRPAELDPGKMHAMKPVTASAPKGPKAPTYSAIVGKTVVEMAKADPRIVGITAAMPEGTGLAALADACPDQFFDVGIAEQHAVTLAAGLACGGMRPVVAIYSTFLQRAYDQVIHDVCLQNLPVTFAIDRAGLVGDDGATHQGLYDLAYLRAVPNMVIMAPKDENELRHMLKTAVEWPGPAAVRYPRGSGYGVPLDQTLKTLPIGEAEILQHGDDVVLLALGSMVMPALEAARMLAQDGVRATVVNARFCKPLDKKCILTLAARVGLIVTIEEHVLAGGFGSAVLECLEEAGLFNVRVKRLGVPDRVIEHATHAQQLAECGLTPQGIREAALQLLGQRQSSKAATGRL
ncbi:MAG TPA: 1-deoxy-D-xylulose-5-phosphate synthase [Limnochordia bacterium]|nr:1-deoxy-D-xylulose-5-phosphate synthase [Limnochordia bacterium]